MHVGGIVMNYVYIVECIDGTYYTGYTNDIKKRITAHNEGKGAKYTRGRTPVQLRCLETYDTKSEALKREYSIKKKSRVEKQKLFNYKE